MRKQYIVIVIVLLMLSAGYRLASSGMANGLFAILKPILIPIAKTYVDLFNTPAAPVLLSILLVILSVVASVWFAAAVRRRLAPLQVAVFNLRNTAARSSTRTALLNEIDNELGLPSDGVFAEEWTLFRASIVEIAGVRDGRPRCVVRPAMYFDLKAFERKGLPITNFLVLPRLFVGIGLVLTLMGLVAGLYLATRGMRTGDPEAARASLIQLLTTSTFSLLTAIAAVAGALIVSFIVQRAVTRLANGVADLCHVIELCLPCHPLEVIVAEIERSRRGRNAADQ